MTPSPGPHKMTDTIHCIDMACINPFMKTGNRNLVSFWGKNQQYPWTSWQLHLCQRWKISLPFQKGECYGSNKEKTLSGQENIISGLGKDQAFLLCQINQLSKELPFTLNYTEEVGRIISFWRDYVLFLPRIPILSAVASWVTDMHLLKSVHFSDSSDKL